MPYSDDFIDILGMERFKLSELLQSTLARLGGGYTILHYQETNKIRKPDLEKAQYYIDKAKSFNRLLNSYGSFEELNGMEKLIEDLKGELPKLDKLRDEMDAIISQSQ